MAKTNKAGAAGQAAALPDAARLRLTLVDIDARACDALEEVAGLAQLALAYMEMPQAYRNPEPIAQALLAIWNAAGLAVDAIGHEADSAGLPREDTAQQRRMHAQMQAQKGGTA